MDHRGRGVVGLLASLLLFAGCYIVVPPRPAQTGDSSQRTCVVLSVGGARGIAHIGAIEALRQRGVRIDCVFGNSMGAVIGGLYASAPQQDLVERYATMMRVYSKASRAKAKARGITGFLAGLGLALASGGTLGWESMVAGMVGGVVHASGTNRLDNRRFAHSYAQATGRVTIESMPMVFATSHQIREGEGLGLVFSTSGPLAPAVAASANNPFIWEDTDVRRGKGLDPGADRVSATPMEDACTLFRPARLIVINVTGKPSFYSRQMDCPFREVTVDFPAGDPASDSLIPGTEDFAAVVGTGYQAVMDAAVR